MNRFRLAQRLALVMLGLGLISGPAEARDPSPAPEQGLAWVAGDLPPFAWVGPKGAQGYAHELAIRMAEKLGRPAEVSYYPWARAVKMTREGQHYGIFPLARTPDRETQFRWLVPLMTVRYSLVGLSGRPAQTLEQLRTQRVGVLRGSPIINNLRAEGFAEVIEARDYKDLLRLLHIDAISAIYAGAPMLNAAIDEYGYERQRFQTHTTLGEATLYMGASLALSEAEAQRWVQAYQQLQADGSVAKLQQQYLRP